MANYVRRAEDCKSVYHSKARGARVASKILEEAEKQAQIGGLTRNIILTSSRMDKMKEAAEKSTQEELDSAKDYRAALELVAKKRNELYSIRMARHNLRICFFFVLFVKNRLLAAARYD